MLEFLADLANWNLLVFAAILLAFQIAAREVGLRFGRHAASRAGGVKEGVSVLAGSALGLVMFVLALTLSAATSRLSERNLGAVEEANAIGTAWLQATALEDQVSADIAALLERYAQSRLTYVRASYESAEVAEATAETNALQTEIWTQMTALIRERADPATTSLMNALNHVFDMTTAQRFAVSRSIPQQLIWMLFAGTICVMGMLGYHLGLLRAPNRTLATLLSILWTAVLLQVLDMGNARIGRFDTEIQPYEWTVESFGPALDTGG